MVVVVVVAVLSLFFLLFSSLEFVYPTIGFWGTPGEGGPKKICKTPFLAHTYIYLNKMNKMNDSFHLIHVCFSNCSGKSISTINCLPFSKIVYGL